VGQEKSNFAFHVLILLLLLLLLFQELDGRLGTDDVAVGGNDETDTVLVVDTVWKFLR
jgi:hypothetical protein